MNKVPVIDYKNFINWAESNTANQVYPLSIAEGNQPGDIYTDNPEQVTAVLFWHFCGFSYLSGTPSKAFLEEIYREFFLKEKERRFLLITDDSDVITFFSGKPGVVTSERIEYKHGGQGKTESSANKTDCRIERIDSEILPCIRGRIIPSFSWDSGEQFLQKGMGFVVREHDAIAAVAFSAAVSSEEIDIGVETMEPFRGKGYAKALTERMCEEILGQGKQPVWAHAKQNLISEKTALHCGFIKDRINVVIRKEEK